MKNLINYIRIWKFEDAPLELQNLSESSGDENWVAVIPPNFKDDYIGWLESGSPFGSYCVEEHKHPTLKGYIVKIGCHG